MVEIISVLSAGTIAVLLEVSALVCGLVASANIDAVSSLLARLALFRRGRVRLRDAYWNIGIVESVLNPRRVLRDFRSCVNVVAAVSIVALEALAVLQAQPGETCVYVNPRQWSVQKKDAGCYVRSFGEWTSMRYGAQAVKLLRDVDLSVGIPENTDVFDESVLNGPAVRQIGKFEKLVNAPLLRAPYRRDQKVYHSGLFFRRWEFQDPRDGNCQFNEETSFSPVALEIQPGADGKNVFYMSHFLQIFSCNETVTISDCTHPRTRFNGADVKELNAKCTVYDLAREERRPSNADLVDLMAHGDVIDADNIRRSILAMRVAQTSASSKPCARYIAARKDCTVIGTVSIVAVVILAILAISTTALRLYLRGRARYTVDWNSTPGHLARSVYEYSRGSGLSGAPEVFDRDLYVSVVPVGHARDAGLFQLAWSDKVEPDDVVHHNIARTCMLQEIEEENLEQTAVESAAIQRGLEERSSCEY